MLTVEQARAQPTLGDAATSVAVQMGLPAKMPVASVKDIRSPVLPGCFRPGSMIRRRPAARLRGPVFPRRSRSHAS